jgi:hypothetical protein
VLFVFDLPFATTLTRPPPSKKFHIWSCDVPNLKLTVSTPNQKPKPQTPNPKPQTPNRNQVRENFCRTAHSVMLRAEAKAQVKQKPEHRKPQTLNPKLQTINPKP